MICFSLILRCFLLCFFDTAVFTFLQLENFDTGAENRMIWGLFLILNVCFLTFDISLVGILSFNKSISFEKLDFAKTLFSEFQLLEYTGGLRHFLYYPLMLIIRAITAGLYVYANNRNVAGGLILGFNVMLLIYLVYARPFKQ